MTLDAVHARPKPLTVGSLRKRLPRQLAPRLFSQRLDPRHLRRNHNLVLFTC